MQWLFNVCYAVIGEDLAAFVKTHVFERHRELAERRDLNIAIDPEVLAVIQASSAISTMKRPRSRVVRGSRWPLQLGRSRPRPATLATEQ